MKNNKKQSAVCNFGEHLMIDGYYGNKEKLNDDRLIEKALVEATILCDMKMLADPVVYFAKPNHIKDPGGWSGYVVVQESHISIHTFPGRGFVSIDVYTCKNGMKTEVLCQFFNKIFELKDSEVNFVKRGTKYPMTDVSN